MLVLNRKIGEEIVIGNGIIVKVISVADGNVKLGIDAPSDIAILRGELYQNVKESVKKASEESKNKINPARSLTINKLKEKSDD